MQILSNAKLFCLNQENVVSFGISENFNRICLKSKKKIISAFCGKGWVVKKEHRY